jgi:DNA-binding YbaB/EbfC family protein
MKNLAGLMKQAQEMQGKMAEMQASMEQMEISGAAGAGLVSVTLNGKGDLKNVQIDASLMKEGEGEILEDLLVAAHGDAKARLERAMAEKMKEVTGGLSLPPGMNLGF